MKKKCPDYDAAFIFYWIAFNAAYADAGVTRDERRDERGEEQRGEREARCECLEKIIRLDVCEKIHKVIRLRFWGPVEKFVKNKYVYHPFWKNHSGLSRYKNWGSWLEEEGDVVHEALKQWDVKDILIILFDRLYVLRNQLIHGGATWQGSVNRQQVEEGALMMALLVPLFIELMMDNPDTDWGTADFPYVEDSDGQ